MTYLYLLDTNIVSDLVKHPSRKIAESIAEVVAKMCCHVNIVKCYDNC